MTDEPKRLSPEELAAFKREAENATMAALRRGDDLVHSYLLSLALQAIGDAEQKLAEARQSLATNNGIWAGQRLTFELAKKERDQALAEAARYKALLEVPLRKMAYIVRDYPGDKESMKWLEDVREALHPKGGGDEQG